MQAQLDSPPLSEFLSAHPAVKSQFEQLHATLRRQPHGEPWDHARLTVAFLCALVDEVEWGEAAAGPMLHYVRLVGREIQAAVPTAVSACNIVRRVLYLIREEYSRGLSELNGGGGAAVEEEDHTHVLSFGNFVGGAAELGERDFSAHLPEFKEAVGEALEELKEETINAFDFVGKQSLDHIHAGATILTYGASADVELFFRAAARRRAFHVVVAEGEGWRESHAMASRLAAKGVGTTVVPDSAIYAVMQRCNQVVLAARAVMADGAAVATGGALMAAVAAKDFALHVVAVAPSFSLSPLFAHTQPWLQDARGPPTPAAAAVVEEGVEVMSAPLDHIPPELVDLYLTSGGGITPSYVYRILSDTYHPDDHDFSANV